MVKKLDDIKEARYNPRVSIKKNKQFYDKLKHSIDKFGLVQPIVWNKRTNTVVGGHQRLQILRDEGISEVECIEVDLTEEDEKALNLSLNKVGGDWDTEMLNSLLTDLKDLDYNNMDITGFDEKEINEIFDQFREPPEETAPLPVSSKYNVQRGEVYQLGEHRLMCGDSTISDDAYRLMDGKKAELFLTDPPYGVDYSEKNTYLNAISRGNSIQTPIENDGWKPDEMPKLWLPSFINAKDSLKNGGAYYIFSANADLLLLLLLCIRDSGLQLKQLIVWVKNNIVLGRRDYKGKHENLIYGWKEGSHKFYGGAGEPTVWEIDKPQTSRLHPTMKPIELLIKAINNSSQKNNIVLDLFGGSGSTLIACEQTHRVCYMMEIDPHYCSVIIERWENYTGKTHKKVI